MTPRDGYEERCILAGSGDSVPFGGASAVFRVWSDELGMDEEDARKVEVEGLHRGRRAAAEAAAERFLHSHEWPDGAPDDVLVRTPDGEIVVVDVRARAEMVLTFHAKARRIYGPQPPTLFWMRWRQYGPGRAVDWPVPDSRPAAWPPPAAVLAFWESGYGGDLDYAVVVALVRVETPDDARAIIEAAWTGPGSDEAPSRARPNAPHELQWAGVEVYKQSGPPNDRFPPPAWSIELGRWPWGVP